MSCIVFEHIQKSFGGRKVLDDVSFRVEEGEIFGLLGPSGAGKTTILNILTGRLLPDGGSASLWGKSCGDGEALRQVGTVLDQDGLYQRLTCRDNLLLYARLYGVERARVRAVLAMVGLAEAEDRQVCRLSKGMRQRLVLARAILHRPGLLFLDEPTSGLDPATMLQIHGLLEELRQQGTTIILTTHNMEEAASLCRRVALLSGGIIVEEGTPRDICLRYDSLRSFHVLLEDGRELDIPRRDAAVLAMWFGEGMIRSIHSSEPNLETVFVEKTGRRLT